ncbi:MAG TPA: hypothetical protein VJL84_05735 [Kiloniellales bacterium]|nr:hypothetical protein [Kiloniellales bacterium]
MTLLRMLLLLLVLARPTLAEELAPASDAEEAVLARLAAAALLAWAEGDTEAILAAEDPGLLAWLNRERSLALTLPVERLLPPFGGEPWPCVPVLTTLRIFDLRQIPPKVLNDLSVAVLLERALTLSAQVEGTLATTDPEALQRLRDDPRGFFREQGFAFLTDSKHAFLAVPAPGEPALALAERSADGRWQVDWRLPLALEELVGRIVLGWAIGASADLRDKAPADWPRDSYARVLAAALPWQPSVADLLALAEPPRPDPSLGCWDPLLESTLALCPTDKSWARCVGFQQRLQ